MAKLVIFGATLIAILAVAQATRFTVTTTITEQKQEPQEECAQQMLPQYFRLLSCQKALIAPFQVKETGKQQIDLQREKNECCAGLKQMNQQCRCQAMREVVRDIQKMESVAEGAFGHQQEMESAFQKVRQAAQVLPNQCNIGGPQQCQIEQPSLLRL